MSLKVYIKDESFDPIYKEVSKDFYARSRVVPSFLIMLGVFVFASQVLLPLFVFKTRDETGEIIGSITVLGRAAGFQYFEFKELNIPNPGTILGQTTKTQPEESVRTEKSSRPEKTLTSDNSEIQNGGIQDKGIQEGKISESKIPVTENQIAENQNLSTEDNQKDNTTKQDEPAEVTPVKDKSQNQEAAPEYANEDVNAPEFFYMSIPKLRIKNAAVETNAAHLNPDKALGHYPDTALPGKTGNTFVFGHSVLPWFYNPKNYKTIFSTLGDLQPGDDVFITYNNRELRYKVKAKQELKPGQVNPLAQIKPKYLNDSTLTLMTCWPAGTKMKRLLVTAEMIK